jgi:hypothetical protein
VPSVHRLAPFALIALAFIDPVASARSPLPGAPASSLVLTYNSPSTTHATNVTLRRDGDDMVLVDDDRQYVVSRRPIGATRRVVVNGVKREHNDSLTVDLRGGLPLPDGVSFMAGVDGFDTLAVLSDPAGEVTFDYYEDDANGHRGRVVVDGIVIEYSGIEPLTGPGPSATVTINLPDGGVSAQLQDDGTPGNNTVKLVGNPLEDTTFFVPTSSLTVNGGNGSDYIATRPSFNTDFHASLTINGATTVGASDTVVLNTLTLGNGGANAGNLIVSGSPTTVAGPIDALGSVLFVGSTSIASNVTSGGPQTYIGSVLLTDSATFRSTLNGDVIFNATVDGVMPLTASSGGNTYFNLPVGGMSPLASLTTDAAGSTHVAANITTVGAQTYADPLVLDANAVLTSTNSGAMTFMAANGNFALTINTAGATALVGAVGSISPLASLTIDPGGGTFLGGGQVITFGPQVYGDVVTLNASATLTAVGAGDVTFISRVDGPGSLVVNTAGFTRFGANVGAGFPLLSLVTDAAGGTVITGTLLVSTLATQTYNDSVALEGNAQIFGTSVAFLGPVSGSFGLTLQTSGTVMLASPNSYSGGTNVVTGTLLLTNVSGSGTGTGPVTINGGTTLAGPGTAGGSVTSQVNGILAPGIGGVGTLTVNGHVTWHGSTTCLPTARFDLGSPHTSDHLAIAGSLFKGSGTRYRFDFQGSGQAGPYALMQFAATTFSASDFSFTNLGGGFGATFAVVNGNTLEVTVGPSAGVPVNLSAVTTSPTAVALTWTSDLPDVDHFEVWRNSGSGFTLLGTAVTPSYTDNTAAANAAYTYKVRAVYCNTSPTGFSGSDLATTFPFSDDPLVAGTPIKAVHVTQLRQAVTAASLLAGAGTPSFTDPSLGPGTVIKLAHMTELRTALDAARTALGLTPLRYTSISQGSLIQASVLTELRNGVGKRP